MTNLTMTTNHDEPSMLTVRIDARRAQMLWHTGSPAATFEFEGRFESLDSDEGVYEHDADRWAEGMLMWCHGALEAMTLADYETSSGFSSRLLWDLCTGPDWEDGHAVLTSRTFGSWR